MQEEYIQMIGAGKINLHFQKFKVFLSFPTNENKTTTKIIYFKPSNKKMSIKLKNSSSLQSIKLFHKLLIFKKYCYMQKTQ